MFKTFIIAEAGVNHNGSLDRALALVDAAAQAGADAVKFQTFKSEAVISRSAVKADYQIRNTGDSESQLEMVKKLELDLAAHQKLLTQCQKRGIQFLSTPFDLPSVDMLVKNLNVQRIKIASGEITNAPLLLHVSRTDLPVILSTGMSTLGDVEDALGVLAFGYVHSDRQPSIAAFRQALQSGEGQQMLAEKVVLLHCTTEYPTPFAEVNLRAIETLRAAFGLPVGLSDHTVGYSAAVAAAALGVCIIEKHFTMDRSLPGPDHIASLEPGELAAMVTAIREVEQAMGSPRKTVAACETKNQAIARKSLVAASEIRAQDIFSVTNLTAKRPGDGISPMHYWSMLGRRASRDYKPDELICEPDEWRGPCS
jgi:N-acetylneuraminate synthase